MEINDLRFVTRPRYCYFGESLTEIRSERILQMRCRDSAESDFAWVDVPLILQEESE